MDRCTRTVNLKEMCSGIRSQRRLMSTGVICSDRWILKMSRAVQQRSEQTGVAWWGWPEVQTERCYNSPIEKGRLQQFSSSRICVMNHNWSATKQCLHPQSVAKISCNSVLSEDGIRQCGTSAISDWNTAVGICRRSLKWSTLDMTVPWQIQVDLWRACCWTSE